MTGAPAVATATSADAPELLRLHPRGPDPRTAAALGLAVCAGRVSTARRDDTLAGFAVLAPWFFEATFVALRYVADVHRRRGVASALLEHLRSSCAGPLLTSTDEWNLSVQAVLERAGWARCGHLVGLDDGDPEVFYRAP